MDNFEVSKEEYDLIQDIKNNKKIVFNYPLDVSSEEDLELVKFVVNWVLISSELRQKGKIAIEEYNKKKSEAIVVENPKCQVFEEDSEKAELLREFFGEIQEENNKNKIFLIISTLIFIAVISFIISIF